MAGTDPFKIVRLQRLAQRHLWQRGVDECRCRWVFRRFYACPENGRAYSRQMIQTIEAIVDERGAVRLLEPVQLDRRHRALVTILTDEPSEAHETALLSESSLAKDWNRPEEDAAWSHLQQAP